MRKTVRGRRRRMSVNSKVAAKLAEIRKGLIATGHDTAHKQAFALGVSRSTAWALLNGDKRSGPSITVTMRILASRHLPRSARRKIEEYIEGKIRGAFGNGPQSRQRWARSFTAQSSAGLLMK